MFLFFPHLKKYLRLKKWGWAWRSLIWVWKVALDDLKGSLFFSSYSDYSFVLSVKITR